MEYTYQLGQEYYNAVKTVKSLTALSNRNKVELGITLVYLESIHHQLGEELGSFKTLLAELHLSYRRVYRLMENARYILERQVPDTYWEKLDSSILELYRKQGIDPVNIEEDFILSYTDIKEKYE